VEEVDSFKPSSHLEYQRNAKTWYEKEEGKEGKIRKSVRKSSP
jgi:hypothetical protein